VRGEALRDLVARALAEDLGEGDITSAAVVDRDAKARASILQKEVGVLFGLEVAAETFRQAGADDFLALVAEGEWQPQATVTVATVAGAGRALLAGERVALNFLGRLSGIATLTARYVRAVEGSGARILDTRKTTPGLRELEKAAVAAGGGSNHRMGLYDAILIKENHAALAGGLGEAVKRAFTADPNREVEVECRTVEEVREAQAAGAHRLLLDNMSPAQLREAVTEAREGAAEGKLSLEASGGVTLDNVAEIASTGVDFISVGELTHSAPALDLGMELEPA
jgi:nicotinate-nucleotide pyrophosphorylase (carboxylating)